MKAWDAYAADCPTRFALDRITDKWTVLLLGLLADGPQRFNALLRQVSGLSQKVLSHTLKRLERDGLVRREAFATVPVTVEYSITPLGAELSGSLKALIAWAESNIESVLSAQARYDAEKAASAVV